MRTIAIDTESHGGVPWSIQVSIRPHTGVMVLLTDKEAVEELVRQVNRLVDLGWELVFHHCVADLDIAELVGINTSRFRDTIQESFHQCSLPQGLKPLAYRMLGVTMRSWEDVVRPASVAAVVNWMEDAMALASTSLQDCTVRKLKRGDKTVLKSGVVEGIMKHVLTHTAKTEGDEAPYDPWEAITRMRVEGLRGKVAEEWEWDWLEHMLGPTPILSIANVPLEDAVAYGVGDADYTLQVAGELERLRGDRRWAIDPGDVDV